MLALTTKPQSAMPTLAQQRCQCCGGSGVVKQYRGDGTPYESACICRTRGGQPAGALRTK